MLCCDVPAVLGSRGLQSDTASPWGLGCSFGQPQLSSKSSFLTSKLEVQCHVSTLEKQEGICTHSDPGSDSCCCKAESLSKRKREVESVRSPSASHTRFCGQEPCLCHMQMYQANKNVLPAHFHHSPPTCCCAHAVRLGQA